MSSLIEDDYNFVMKDNPEVKYSFVSYISLMDFPEINHDFNSQKQIS